MIHPLAMLKPISFFDPFSSHADCLNESNGFPIIQIDRRFQAIQIELAKSYAETSSCCLLSIPLSPMPVIDLISEVCELVRASDKDIEIDVPKQFSGLFVEYAIPIAIIRVSELLMTFPDLIEPRTTADFLALRAQIPFGLRWQATIWH
jgi:hypothetical protein